MNENEMLNSIAIIGMAGNFPKAPNLEKFWEKLLLGEEGISYFTKDELIENGEDINLLNNPNYVPAKGILENPYGFDAAFFGISPKEATILDPQQRLFLECCYHAIEDSGIDLNNSANSIGVFGAESWSTYLLNQIAQNPNVIKDYDNYQLMLGNDKDYLATRVSFKLNLSGPSVSVQTACSSSLVGIHLACQSLLLGECDTALAGGVSVSFPQRRGYLYKKEMIMSKDGHCRPFDEAATGTVESNGVGVVLLKRLEDAIKDKNHIYAIIRGSAINNDGAGKVGYTAPSVIKQADVISEAISVAGVKPSDISYIETHGTGTKLGDSIEIEALKKVFKHSSTYCPIGSLKSNFGHMNAAAGVASLIKTALSLENEVIPKSIITDNSREKSDLDKSPFYLNTELNEWKRSKKSRLAGVSSFGIGGTNVHIILEEAPIYEELNKTNKSIEDTQDFVLTLSAKTKKSLEINKKNLINYLIKNKNINIENVSYTLQNCKEAFNYRQTITCKSVTEAIDKLNNENSINEADKFNGIVFMFSGQGSQFIGMSRRIYEIEPRYREIFDTCCNKADIMMNSNNTKETILELENSYEHSEEKLKNTSITQIALFIVEYSLSYLLMEYGIEPDIMMGHSIGEYVAATLAHVISLDDALKIIIYRGKLMQTMEEGDMISIALSEEEIIKYLDSYSNIDIAAVNSVKSCVVSGEKTKINKLKLDLDKQGIKNILLHTSHAFHSYMMRPVMDKFRKYLENIDLKAPKKKIVSCMTGSIMTDEQACSPSYWAGHIRNTVRFYDMVKFLKEKGFDTFIEIGPGKVLTSLVKQAYIDLKAISILTSIKDKHNEEKHFMETLGKLWSIGVKVDWKKLCSNTNRTNVKLPLYSFDHLSYKFDNKNNIRKSITEKEETEINTYYDRKYINCTYVEPENELACIICNIWENIFSIKPIGMDDDFFELGGNSLISIQFIERVKEVLLVDISITELFEIKTVKNIVNRIFDKISNLSDKEAEEVLNKLNSYEFN